MFELLEARRMFAVLGTWSPLYIQGTSGNDTITMSQSGETLTVVKNGVTQTHALRWVSGVGDSVNEPVIYSGINKLVVRAFGGNDNVQGDESVLKAFDIDGGEGSDTLQGGSRNDILTGGGGSHEVIYGGGGHDDLRGSGFGTNAMYGGDGNDTLTGGLYDDDLYGYDGNDRLLGKSGDDYLSGGNDNDYLAGDVGEDDLFGGAGNDTLLGSDGYGWEGDELWGGSGNDTIDHSAITAALRISLDGVANDGQSNEGDNVHTDIETVIAGAGNDLITGSAFNNRIEGGNGNDTLRGGGGNDTILGGSGRDSLYGDSGNDSIHGGIFDDSLYGGAGDDILNGGDGSDILVAVGGGALDQLNGGDNDSSGNWLDEFYLDADLSETHNATSAEAAGDYVHRISHFELGVSKELNGQNLSDPGIFWSDVTAEYLAVASPDGSRFDDNPLFTFGYPRVTDVDQGAVGDCYFLAGLGAIARANPDRIERSVVDLGDNTYAVRFYDELGFARYYRVDNDLPALAEHGVGSPFGLAYANLGDGNSTTPGAMWVPIMEKAYCFYRGGSFADYGDIDGGYANEAYEAMGVSWYDKDVDDDNALQHVANALAAGKAVSVDTISGDFTLGDSIVLSHVYTVYSVDVANNTITVYNPWGTDAGNVDDGAWTQGASNGFVTFTYASFQEYTDDFWIATV